MANDEMNAEREALAVAFTSALINAFGPSTLATAIRHVSPLLHSARQDGVAWRDLALFLSSCLESTGRPPISADTLRGYCSRQERVGEAGSRLAKSCRNDRQTGGCARHGRWRLRKRRRPQGSSRRSD